MDRIIIEDLRLRCVIGLHEWERDLKQDILLNISLFTDLRPAARSDGIADTVDYKSLKLKLVGLVENSSFKLIETLAEKVAELCLRQDHVQAVKVRLDKPGALRYARTVAVEIERAR